jgi:hypothetical protein
MISSRTQNNQRGKKLAIVINANAVIPTLLKIAGMETSEETE